MDCRQQPIRREIRSVDLATLTDYARDWAIINGMCIRPAESCDDSSVVEVAPFTLFPSPFSIHLYREAVDLQKDISLLYHRVAYDYEFMESALKSVVNCDPFVAKLFEIYSKVMEDEKVKDRIVLNIQRSDYLIHEEGGGRQSLKQVEVNNISASFAALGTQCTQLHMHISKMANGSMHFNGCVPTNDSLDTVVTGLVKAWASYSNLRAVILILTEDELRNFADQRLIEYHIARATSFLARVRRLRLNDTPGRLMIESGRLVLLPERLEVAVVYYRSGYVPEHYLYEGVWQMLLLVETSKAIKCPWIGFHLAGTKKVQQMLTKRENLRRFISDEETIDRILNACMPMYGLEMDSAQTERVVEMVLSEPDRYVLKPQLEGGGHNLYGKKIVELLTSCKPQDRQSYIVMEKINPSHHENVIVRRNQRAVKQSVVSELGTFGFLIGCADKVLSRRDAGHLLRTKPYLMEEGGIMAGAACLDSPLLCED